MNKLSSASWMLVPAFVAVLAGLLFTGCPFLLGEWPEGFDLATALVGTWEDHGGGNLTFNVDGTFTTGEFGSQGTYEVVGNSVLLDINGLEGELNGLLTYVGTRPSGQLLFAQETPFGLTRSGGK